jgi:two-component system nitrate/nitrite response regulator NarL
MSPEEATGPGTIRVLVVEDDDVIRGLLVMACERDPRLELAGEVSTGAEALESARAVAPDVIVLDVGLPDMNGLDVARGLREEGFAGRLLILTSRSDQRTIFEARAAGADGFVEKTGAIGRIGEVIAGLVDAAPAFSDTHERAARSELRERITHAREASRAAGLLTDRELDVLRRVAAGATTRQVARALDLSERTVEAHIGKLYRKLGVSSRIQAVSAASSLGLLRD